jgi:hypothetical protein
MLIKQLNACEGLAGFSVKALGHPENVQKQSRQRR